jgi:hypothetical protein
VTPATPAFQLLRVTSESLSYQPETQLSNELNPARQVSDIIVTGGNSSGECGMELSSNPGFELLLEGALGNLWGGDGLGDDLWVSGLLLTHTIEKRFTIDAANVDPLKQYEFNRFVREIVDQMVLTFTPGGPATGSASLLGGAMTRDEVDLTGATYLDAGQLPVMVGAGVIPITFTIEGIDYTTWCVSNLVVTLRNNGRAIMCLGQDVSSETVLGRFECEVAAEIYLAADTSVVMDAFLNRTEIAMKFEVHDSLGNGYQFTFPRVRVSACTEVASGTNQDVIMSTSLQALVDTATVTPTLPATPFDVDSCILIKRVHVTTPWPEGPPTLRELNATTGAALSSAPVTLHEGTP